MGRQPDRRTCPRRTEAGAVLCRQQADRPPRLGDSDRRNGGVSDATVVRTAKALGFDGLSGLREYLLADMTGSPSPGGRLARTLDEAGDDPAAALSHVIGVHQGVLEVLARPQVGAAFSGVVKILSAAAIATSSASALGRAGRICRAAIQPHRHSDDRPAVAGVGLADRLLRLKADDAILMIAYAPLYREVAVVLEAAEQVGLSRGADQRQPRAPGRDTVAADLPVPRGQGRSPRHARRDHGAARGRDHRGSPPRTGAPSKPRPVQRVSRSDRQAWSSAATRKKSRGINSADEIKRTRSTQYNDGAYSAYTSNV